MSKAAIVCVGKLKAKFWQEACEYYLKALTRWRQLSVIEIKDSSLAPKERPLAETRELLTRVEPRDLPVALLERGESMTSQELAAFLKHCDERLAMRPTFIIGGPFGLETKLLPQSTASLSLSSMTLTHEMARALLIEQIYRAESILHNTPYHH